MKQQLVTIVLGEVIESLRGNIARPAAVKSAPAYVETAIPRQTMIGREQVSIDGRVITFELKSYPPDVLLIQSSTDIEDIFTRSVHDLEEQIYSHAYKILESRGGKPQFSEQYSIFTVSDYQGEPEQFLVHAPVMASLLKSERLDLDSREVKYTMDAQIKYAKNDLAIIDWDGAFLFDPAGDLAEDIELLTLANLQLLRHRMLDRQLDHRLAHVGRMVPGRKEKKRLFFSAELADDLRDLIRTRMLSISELQRLERDIKLIGDWYSARFFNLAATKFRIDDWRKSIQGKLDSLEDAYSVVSENFTVSAKHRAEWIQIIAFFVLQIGWFGVLILEAIVLYFQLKHLPR
jgi:hypothetical protein